MDTAPRLDACRCDTNPGEEIARFDLGEDGIVRLVRCPRCGLAALVPRPTEAVLRRWYDAGYYGAEHRRKFVGPLARAVARFQRGRARLAARCVPERGRLLDVGCGDGGFLQEMRRLGFVTEGTERTAESAARVPAAPGLRVYVGDLLDLDLPAEAYDVVTLWHVLEHLPEPEATLRCIHGLLRPGGKLLLSLPNAESWQARLFGRHWFHHDPPRHLYAFGPPTLVALLRRVGFVVEGTSTFSLEQNPYGVMQSALNALGFPRDRAYDLLKGLRPATRSTRLLDLALLGILAPPALAFALVESMAGRGGTMLVSARRPGG